MLNGNTGKENFTAQKFGIWAKNMKYHPFKLNVVPCRLKCRLIVSHTFSTSLSLGKINAFFHANKLPKPKFIMSCEKGLFISRILALS